MASEALVMRFMTTCCTWPASASMEGSERSRRMSSVAVLATLARSRCAFSSTSSLRSIPLTTNRPLPE